MEAVREKRGNYNGNVESKRRNQAPSENKEGTVGDWEYRNLRRENSGRHSSMLRLETRKAPNQNLKPKQAVTGGRKKKRPEGSGKTLGGQKQLRER